MLFTLKVSTIMTEFIIKKLPYRNMSMTLRHQHSLI